MPGTPVKTPLSPARLNGGSPVAAQWHPTAQSASVAPPMPHGLTPWPGAAPQSTLKAIRNPRALKVR